VDSTVKLINTTARILSTKYQLLLKRCGGSQFRSHCVIHDRLCGLVVRVSGYRYRVRSPALPDFLSSIGSGTGSTQPREPREVN